MLVAEKLGHINLGGNVMMEMRCLFACLLYVMLCYVMLCCVMLCYVMFCFVATVYLI